MKHYATTAFVLTLLAALAMFSSGGMMYYNMGPPFISGQGSWMWGHGIMRGMMGTTSPGVSFLWLGGAAGTVLLIASIFLYSKPEKSHTWGLVIIGVAVLNLFVGMGSFIATVLGVAGGALAMLRKSGNA